MALACGVSDTFAQDYSAPIPRFLLNKKIFNGPESAVIDGVPSVPLRASAKALGGEVFWDADTMTASVYYDGEVYVCDGALRNDMMMASLDFFKSAFGAQTAYYKNENIIAISAGGDLPSKAEALKLLPTYDGYSEEDLDWLAKIVDAEAKGESYDSKLGVASVIINRKESGQYPETIKGVIFDKKHGVQFTPTLNGTVYNTPSTQSYLVALDALEGRNNASSTLFFLNPKIASSTWVQKNRQYAFTIGGHSYYY